MYDQGWGVEQNNVESLKWYEKAANQGHAQAQAHLENLQHDLVKDFESTIMLEPFLITNTTK